MQQAYLRQVSYLTPRSSEKVRKCRKSFSPGFSWPYLTVNGMVNVFDVQNVKRSWPKSVSQETDRCIAEKTFFGKNSVLTFVERKKVRKNVQRSKTAGSRKEETVHCRLDKQKELQLKEMKAITEAKNCHRKRNDNSFVASHNTTGFPLGYIVFSQAFP